jgi:RNA polymerase sigma-70 factor (ECF subfamily)
MSTKVMGSANGTSPDERAVRALYVEHGPAIHAYALRLLDGDAHLAEDVLQETLLRCWRKRNLADREGMAIRPYMFRIARNLVIDVHRARTARPLEFGDTGQPAERAGDVDDIDRMLSAMVVNDALTELTPAHREILQATFLTGHTLQQAARCLGIPQGTAKSRVHYALRRLKDVLKERDMR